MHLWSTKSHKAELGLICPLSGVESCPVSTVTLRDYRTYRETSDTTMPVASVLLDSLALGQMS